MTAFQLSACNRGHGPLGFYGSRTGAETPGPGSYDAFPFTNPDTHRTSRPTHFPDRAPGFVNVVGRHPLDVRRPEPWSLSRRQLEQPLLRYSSATFWHFAADSQRKIPGTLGYTTDVEGLGASRRNLSGARSRSQPLVGVGMSMQGASR